VRELNTGSVATTQIECRICIRFRDTRAPPAHHAVRRPVILVRAAASRAARDRRMLPGSSTWS